MVEDIDSQTLNLFYNHLRKPLPNNQDNLSNVNNIIRLRLSFSTYKSPISPFVVFHTIVIQVPFCATKVPTAGDEE
jgi:hypothetical protein